MATLTAQTIKPSVLAGKNFVYLSHILNLPVIDINTNKRIGRTSDVVAIMRDIFPKITALIVRKGLSGEAQYIPWKNIRKLVEEKVIFIELPSESELKTPLTENDILLKETFYDKQIVDTSGAKVVRVNDLHMLREDSNLWVAHMDIGFRGLLRRLNWEKPFNFLSQWLFSYEVRERLISWKYVQALTTTALSDSLHLKIPYSKLSELHPADLAEVLNDLSVDERVIIFKSLEVPVAATALQELPLKVRVQTAELLAPALLAPILNEMPMDETVDLMDELPKKVNNALFNLLPPEKVAQIKNLLEHSKNVAGSIMTTEFVAVKNTLPAGEILAKIKADHKKTETIYYVYVLDDGGSLIGVTTLKYLLLADPLKPVFEFMRKKVVKARPDTQIKKVLTSFYKYNFDVLPVTDRAHKLVGLISMKDALEAVFPEIREGVEESKE